MAGNLPGAGAGGRGEGGEGHLTSNFCRSSSLPSLPSGGTGTLKYSPSSWLSNLNLKGAKERQTP